jgi:hypothetical protein
VSVCLAGQARGEMALESFKAVWFSTKPLLSEMMEE